MFTFMMQLNLKAKPFFERHAKALSWVFALFLLLSAIKTAPFLIGTSIQIVQRVYVELAPGGLVVQYYEDTEFKSLVRSRSERAVDKRYYVDRIARGVSTAHFGAVWEGYLVVPEDGEYGFFMQSMDGSRMYLNGELIVDHWESRNWAPGKHGRADLESGRQHIRIEHVVYEGPAAIRLRWVGPTIPPDTVLSVPHIVKE